MVTVADMEARSKEVSWNEFTVFWKSKLVSLPPNRKKEDQYETPKLTRDVKIKSSV